MSEQIDWEASGPRPPATHEQIDRLRAKLQAAQLEALRFAENTGATVGDLERELQAAQDLIENLNDTHDSLNRTCNILRNQLSAANARIDISDQALKALQEATGSDNTENPWIGVCASVMLLKMRIAELESELESWKSEWPEEVDQDAQ